MTFLLQARIRGRDGQSRPSAPFDRLHEYASGLHVSECPFRFASACFRDGIFMNNAGSKAPPQLQRLYCPRLAIVAVHSSHAQRFDSHGDIPILWGFAAEPSIGL